MFAKLFSAFLSVLFMLQTLFPAFLGAKNERFNDEALASLSSPADYVAYIREYGAPSMDTATFFDAFRPIKVLRSLFSGSLFKSDEERYIPVSMSEDLTEMCDAILAESGFSMLDSLRHIPKSLGALTAFKRSLKPDLTEFRHKAFDLSDQVRATGHTGAATLIYLFGVFFSVADDISIYTVPGEGDGVLTVLMDVTYADGTTETVDPDIEIDTVNGIAYAKQGYGVSGSGFEVSLDDMLLYTVVNAWQREYGFGLGYDLHAASGPVFTYLTRRFPFRYGDKAWQIQIWKGNYALVTNGGEVGVYTRSPERVGTFYEAADDGDMLTMSMDVLHGDELLVSRAPQTHWWVTGFRMSKNLYTPDSLTMKFSVTVKDAEMLAAFTGALDSEAHGDVSYTVDGLTVYGIW